MPPDSPHTAHVADIKSRCEVAGIPVSEEEMFEDPVLEIEMPCGSGTRTVIVRGEEAEDFAATEFEKFRFLEGYDAIVCLEDGTIEAFVNHAGGGPNLRGLLLARLGLRQPTGEGDPPAPKDPIVEVASDAGTRLTLGFPSLVLQALGWGGPGRVALRLEKVSVDRSDQASGVLERLANGLFFQIDALLGIPIILNRRRFRRGYGPGRKATVSDIRFPESEYDPEPMSLYWYGRGARGMPLLQFLAYYQVLEFYFPMYSAAEARRRIRLILASPSFSSHNERDIQRVFLASTAGSTGSRAGERSQLRATISHCAEPEQVRKFVGPPKSEVFAKKAKGLTDQVVNHTMNDADLLKAVADRVYDIRCKIVHTKDSDQGEDVGLLLPFSQEADQLGLDIRLVEILARQALVSASRASEH